MMGQDAINVINGFNDKLKLTGAILTKMDGNTKGGVSLSVRKLTNIPIKFIGDSEKLDGLSEFYPERMAERIKKIRTFRKYNKNASSSKKYGFI